MSRMLIFDTPARLAPCQLCLSQAGAGAIVSSLGVYSAESRSDARLSRPALRALTAHPGVITLDRHERAVKTQRHEEES